MLPITAVGTQNKLILLNCPWKYSRYCSSVNSCDPPPVPIITPKRRRSSTGREVRPALSSASLAAHRANGRIRETCLRSFFSTQASSSKPETSPAIWTSMAEESNREIRRTPLRPSSTACEKAGVPVPLGLTTPIPVITQRRFIESLSRVGLQACSPPSQHQAISRTLSSLRNSVGSLSSQNLVKPLWKPFFVQALDSTPEIKVIIYLAK